MSDEAGEKDRAERDARKNPSLYLFLHHRSCLGKQQSYYRGVGKFRAKIKTRNCHKIFENGWLILADCAIDCSKSGGTKLGNSEYLVPLLVLTVPRH